MLMPSIDLNEHDVLIIDFLLVVSRVFPDDAIDFTCILHVCIRIQNGLNNLIKCEFSKQT